MEKEIKYAKCPICGKPELKPHTELCNCWRFVNNKIVKKEDDKKCK